MPAEQTERKTRNRSGDSPADLIGALIRNEKSQQDLHIHPITTCKRNWKPVSYANTPTRPRQPMMLNRDMEKPQPMDVANWLRCGLAKPGNWPFAPHFKTCCDGKTNSRAGTHHHPRLPATQTQRRLRISRQWISSTGSNRLKRKTLKTGKDEIDIIIGSYYFVKEREDQNLSIAIIDEETNSA